MNKDSTNVANGDAAHAAVGFDDKRDLQFEKPSESYIVLCASTAKTALQR